MSLRRIHPSHPDRAVAVTAALLVAAALSSVLSACGVPKKEAPAQEVGEANAPASAPAARSKSAIGAGTEEVGRTAAELEQWLRSHVEADTRAIATRAQLEVAAEGKHWRLTFPDRLLAPGQPVTVEVVRHPAMTVMMVPLLKVPKNPPSEILGALLAQNYELYQAKLSLGPQGDLYVSYEVPNRLLDRQELLENVEDLSLLAQNLTGLIEQRLVELALGVPPSGGRAGPSPQQGPPPGQLAGQQGPIPGGPAPGAGPREGFGQPPAEFAPPGGLPPAPVAGTPER